MKTIVQTQQHGPEVAEQNRSHFFMEDGYSYPIFLTSGSEAESSAKKKGTPKRMRIEGFRSRLGGIDAELDQYTGEILRTFDPVTGKLLLEFPAESFPAIENYQDRPLDVARDRGLTTEYSDTDASPINAVENLIAYAVIRDRIGLPPQSLNFHKNCGWSAGTAKFVNQECAALMAFTGLAWDAVNGVMPNAAGLERPLETLSKVPAAHYTKDEKRLPIAEVIKWRLSETVAILDRHQCFIRSAAWKLAECKSINWHDLTTILHEEMSDAREMNPQVFGGITPFSLTVR